MEDDVSVDIPRWFIPHLFGVGLVCGQHLSNYKDGPSENPMLEEQMLLWVVHHQSGWLEMMLG